MLPAQIGQIGQPDREFTGHPVSLDFQGADLRAVLRTFAEISGLNLVIDPSVSGSVDVTLRDVPWDQALDLILKANKLGYVVDGTIVRVAPLTVLAEEEAQRRKLAEEQALAGALNVVTRPLSYARAEDIRTLITRSALTPRGEVEVDVRTNTLIIRDLPAALQVANDLIAKLDTPQPQVEIEARIVQTTRDFARSIGVQWGLTGRMDPALGNTTGLAFPNSGSLTGRVGGIQGPNGADNAVSREPTPPAARWAWRSGRSTARSTSTWRSRRSKRAGRAGCSRHPACPRRTTLRPKSRRACRFRFRRSPTTR
jgi:type IV pilus assembly protein PilQ